MLLPQSAELAANLHQDKLSRVDDVWGNFGTLGLSVFSQVLTSKFWTLHVVFAPLLNLKRVLY